MIAPSAIAHAVDAALRGDLAAFGSLVDATQAMAHAVARRVLRHEQDARDAVQEAYLAAFRRLRELEQPEAFAGWLRRIVIAAALNHRRRTRPAWVPFADVEGPPVLDAAEERWSDAQQRSLAKAVLSLSVEERRLCELAYHGGHSAERLARAAGIDPPAMRKRLQRIRDKLRKETEMDEQRASSHFPIPSGLSTAIIELLARPRLVDLPENPVGATLAVMRGALGEFEDVTLPEEVDLDVALQRLGGDAVYIDRAGLHRVEGERVLRYDLTLPLLLSVVGKSSPSRLAAAGKVYRRERESATHLEAFHQLELFALDARTSLDAWSFAGRILHVVDRALPRSEVRMTPTEYPMCARAWSLDVRRDDDWIEVMAWGEYAGWVMRALGADASTHVAVGAGFGLDRFAALRYGIDDVRKIASARVTPG